jgi:hypothetical protein
MRDDRVLTVHDRVRPPRERPDEDLRIGARTDVPRARVQDDPQPEEREGREPVQPEGADQYVISE